MPFTMQNAIDERWVHINGFTQGFHDGCRANFRNGDRYHGVEGQAYDRGLQVGLQTQRNTSEPGLWTAIMHDALNAEPESELEKFKRETEERRAERKGERIGK